MVFGLGIFRWICNENGARYQQNLIHTINTLSKNIAASLKVPLLSQWALQQRKLITESMAEYCDMVSIFPVLAPLRNTGYSFI
mgnify:FL=1